MRFRRNFRRGFVVALVVAAALPIAARWPDAEAPPAPVDPADFLPHASTSSTAGVELIPPMSATRPPVTVLPGSATEDNDMGDPTFVPPTTKATPRDTSPADSAGRWEVSATMYCLRGTTASGDPVADGIVAVHSSRFRELLDTRWRVVEGDDRILGRTFVVRDHGPGADFDVWESSCDVAVDFGRRPAVVVPA